MRYREPATHGMRGKALLCAAAAFCLLISTSIYLGYGKAETATAAAAYYVDPVNGSDANNGSYDAPWKTINLSKVGAGDTLFLRSGSYGSLSVSGRNYSDYLTIAAQPGHTPVFSGILITNCSKMKLVGLTSTGTKKAPRANEVRYNLISCTGRDLVIEGCTAYSVPSIAGWTATDWNNLASSGIQTWGDNMVIRGNRVYNVDFGIEFEGTGCLMEHNTIENYCGDGINLKGPRNEICQYNTIKNHYKTNDNHGDMIQVYYSPCDNNPIYGVVLRGNLCIAHEDPNQPYRHGVQGIGAFGNNLVNAVVENNVVLLSNWNGIFLYGAVGARAVNNTVMDPFRYYDKVDHPVISIEKALNGTPSRDCVVRNNIVGLVWSPGAENATIDHNLTGRFDPGTVFADFTGLDLRLKLGSPAIDAGAGDLAPATDIEGNSRPLGAAWDIGAYEFAAATPPVSQPPGPARYTITASAGAGGSISPSGKVTVDAGSSQAFTITPAEGYRVSGVEVDGTNVGAVTTYVFDNVTADHTISATFAAEKFIVAASASNKGGKVSPASQTVVAGGTASVKITPRNGFYIDSITDNGVPVPVSGTYTIYNVTCNHYISVTFKSTKLLP